MSQWQFGERVRPYQVRDRHRGMAAVVEGIDAVAKERCATADQSSSGKQFLLAGGVGGSAVGGVLRGLGGPEDDDQYGG
jgi:hypothetical protein